MIAKQRIGLAATASHGNPARMVGARRLHPNMR
jgi:hypothetical protein